VSEPDDSIDVDEVMANPALLRGLEPGEASIRIKRSSAWRQEVLNRGSHAGSGWVLREYEGESPTGRVIRWHPGGGHHGPAPYWRVSSPREGRSQIVR
jgi:hypothetical protein